MRPAKICPNPGCTNLQPCAQHNRAAWATSNRREHLTLSGSRQQKRARYILDRDNTICHVCGLPGADQADHITPLAHGGTDTTENMAAIHAEPCHREKTAREARNGR